MKWTHATFFQSRGAVWWISEASRTQALLLLGIGHGADVMLNGTVRMVVGRQRADQSEPLPEDRELVSTHLHDSYSRVLEPDHLPVNLM
jgi:hypothetical protein